MRRRILILLSVIWLTFMLIACGQLEGERDVSETIFTEAATGEEVTPVPTEIPAESDTDHTEEEIVIPEGIWTPAPAPAIRNTLSEEEKAQVQQSILEKGTFLFSGDRDRGYYPGKTTWLSEAKPEDAIALIYACDDLTHGGWGVLGFGASVGGKHSNIMDITAMSDDPARERLLVISIAELLQAAGTENVTELKSFSLGAWNGGRIAGLYYLPQDVAEELNEYLMEVEETEKIMHTYTGELSNPTQLKMQRLYTTI